MPHLTLKQKRFVKEYVKTGSALAATKKSYDVHNNNSAGVVGSKLLKNANIQEAIELALEQEGLTNEYFASELHHSIEAGRDIKASEDTRLRAMELAMKLGRKIGSAEPGSTTNNTYINNLKVLSNDDLRKRVASIEAEIVKK